MDAQLIVKSENLCTSYVGSWTYKELIEIRSKKVINRKTVPKLFKGKSGPI